MIPMVVLCEGQGLVLMSSSSVQVACAPPTSSYQLRHFELSWESVKVPEVMENDPCHLTVPPPCSFLSFLPCLSPLPCSPPCWSIETLWSHKRKERGRVGWWEERRGGKSGGFRPVAVINYLTVFIALWYVNYLVISSTEANSMKLLNDSTYKTLVLWESEMSLLNG